MQKGAGAFLSLPLAKSFFHPANFHPMNLSNLKTPLCDLLHVQYPVLQAGMGEVAGPKLVAAICNAGGLGILAGTMVPPDQLRAQIRRVRELTDKPFGLNLILQEDIYRPKDPELSDETVGKVQTVLNDFRAKLELPSTSARPGKLPPLIQAAFEILLEEKVPVFSIGLGNPTPEMVERCKAKGILVMAMVCTLADARAVENSGVDIIVAQGSEAGGHRSTWIKKPSGEYAAIGTLPLVSQMVESVKVPVVAAGGIARGKDIVAALMLGAQGVMIGTRFVATEESGAPECYKKKLVSAGSDDTTVTDVFTGMYARVIRNEFTETYAASQAPVLPPGLQLMTAMDVIKTAGERQNADYYTLYSGQGIDHIKAVKPAKVVMQELIEEALLQMRSGTMASEVKE